MGGNPAPAASGRRREVLALLRESRATWDITALARRLAVHPNTIRFHLDALVGAGQVERVDARRPGPGRPPLLFRAKPGMDPAGPREYRLLAGILVDEVAQAPDPVRSAGEAGRRWGARLAGGTPRSTRTDAVEHLVGLLDELGFRPETRARGAEIGLRHCPFLELAEQQRQVVCQVHLGLMQGVTAATGSPVTVDRLDAFVEPDLCVAHLAPEERV
ncbi:MULTISPECIES: metalloregulator ArsR/SmtB family transcription factor [unclassified Saccharopolyspora]|uniref:helix-turn-helix transcriptional regulator n=1 Tax=unclassified Saccharopolyspora TaxID=2646250 RepID=UPI001CD671D4|nr:MULTISPECIES: transcriptional regulator [unclassified Saccharopolyspora]MCA1195385.1 transcriptional regulator [Saccharopolyspora sp. 6V]MCA1228619.1 transcriptional regulator [Saccharopolyspora sp. 6M]MCA1283251.1 transcriptional regulator [Saccharopolyspora sp. 7B]